MKCTYIYKKYLYLYACCDWRITPVFSTRESHTLQSISNFLNVILDRQSAFLCVMILLDFLVYCTPLQHMYNIYILDV